MGGRTNGRLRGKVLRRVLSVSVLGIGGSLIILVLSDVGCRSRRPEVYDKIEQLLPKDEDFAFKAPDGWGPNLLEKARIVEKPVGEKAASVAKIVDGRPSSSWTSTGYGHKPVFIFGLGQTVELNRLVIYNRHTNALGTGGGNNAARELVISSSTGSPGDTFVVVAEAILPSPRAHCVEHGDKRICFFIDNTEPTILEFEKGKTRLLRIQLLSAYWSPIAEDTWPERLSYALSEVMAFSVK
jgi:hypothetical protein